MKRAVKLILLAIISLLTFVLLAYLSKIFIISKLGLAWQNDLLWLGSTAVATVSILAGLGQITGITLKDIFSSSEPQKSLPIGRENIAGSIIINANSQGKQNFLGDIMQSSTKVVIEKATIVNSPENKTSEKVERLIRDIQAVLYGEEKQLPYALALCLDLCQQVGLSSKYELWLRKELNGYDDHENFKKSFPNEQAFEEWMRQWANHRLIKSYIKFGYRSTETNRWNVEDWPFESILLGFPLPEIIQTFKNASDDPNQEFAISVKSLGQGRLEKLQNVVLKHFPKVGVEVPDDLLAYYKSSDLKKLLNGVRDLVLSLLSEARRLEKEG